VSGADDDDVEGRLHGSRSAHHDKLPNADIFKATMPVSLRTGAPTLLIRRAAYERADLARAAIDERLGLTPEEFRVEGDVVVLGPVYDAEAFAEFIEDLERLGLAYYDDFFELSGNWPDWLTVLAASAAGPGRSNPSQPQA
jgi:hypothetical protein